MRMGHTYVELWKWSQIYKTNKIMRNHPLKAWSLRLSSMVQSQSIQIWPFCFCILLYISLAWEWYWLLSSPSTYYICRYRHTYLLFVFFARYNKSLIMTMFLLLFSIYVQFFLYEIIRKSFIHINQF